MAKYFGNKSSSQASYRKGDYMAQCDYSGIPYYASEMRMTWDGFFVHKDLWEPRHPQDAVVGVRDSQAVKVARPLKFNYI